jgi:predicted hotdog family 3-hydroxylacyl-ACP dehydratase
MLLNHEQLCRLIPHNGTMCLLDSVINWDDESILCRAVSQCDPNNPLRANSTLSAINGVEFAAQAMAVHGALLQGDEKTPASGYLAALRGVRQHCKYLHDQAELFLHCQRLGGDSNGFIYAFAITNGETLLLEGRATVIKSDTTTHKEEIS